ncbi:37S ribosomal protein S35, mitochondrial [Lachnellula occidentalis]|uniref:37S ribosomal protein S35, mitochondrial n=1 Tax=Lachnellula occidentalis TaxID=215460 RepID=A0A8H8S4H9_9HELO|nr:37S ribosomal protein S35, mitochondrial [Lachnellula occidentalis]
MPPSLRLPSVLSSTPCGAHQLCRSTGQSSRPFSTTLRHDHRVTRARRGLFRWLSLQGENFRNPLSGSTNYLGAYDNRSGVLRRVQEAELRNTLERQNGEAKPEKTGEQSAEEKSKIPPEEPRDRVPFPQNKSFLSQAVLSEELREEIWSRVMKEGQSVREVSVTLRVEMSRVGAVVRLKEVEKEWKRIGKPLARPYAQAVMSMLPQTPFDPSKPDAHGSHESINDLPVHASTGQQIFHPTSESRHFTRLDAAKVFNKRLLPADDRIPHPELVIQHRERVIDGLTVEERKERAELRAAEAEEKRERIAAKQAAAEARVKKIDSGRWEFRFTPINADDAGKDGRGHRGIGWRYGVPLYDRSRGQIKIPKSVG